MAVRYICDRCGETNETVGRFSLNHLCVSSPDKTDVLPKFDGELCGVCLGQICGMIKEAIASRRQS